MEVFPIVLMITSVLTPHLTAQNIRLDPAEVQNIYLQKFYNEVTNGTDLTKERLENYFQRHAIYTPEGANITRCIVQYKNGSVKIEEDCLLRSVSILVTALLHKI